MLLYPRPDRADVAFVIGALALPLFGFPCPASLGLLVPHCPVDCKRLCISYCIIECGRRILRRRKSIEHGNVAPMFAHRITSRNRRGFSQIAAYTHRLPHTAIRPAGRPQWWTGGRNPSTARTPGNTPAPLLPPRTASMTSRASAQRMALCTATIPQRRPVPRHGSGFAQAPRHSRTP